MTIDYLIIGQGIAGSSIAQRLISSGKSIKIIDQLRPDQSSRLASGIWNPIVLKRMKKVWQSDEMLHLLPSFYRQAEERYALSFIEDIHVHRLFASEEETNEWTAKADQPVFDNILNPLPTRSHNDNILDTYGLGEVTSSGRINTVKWLNAARKWFLNNSLLLEENFEYNQLEVIQNGIQYGDLKASNIIFCEGMFTALRNPYFNWLPFALTKGEVIHLHSPSLQLDKIINGSVFILPLGNDEYKVGATYSWHTTDTTPTEEAKDELLNKLKKIIDAPFEILAHKAGIRPTVNDRRPLLGTHPEHSQLHIFNGLGSRGVLMAPYLSKMMTENLLKGNALHPEADIDRFLKKHYRS